MVDIAATGDEGQWRSQRMDGVSLVDALYSGKEFVRKHLRLIGASTLTSVVVGLVYLATAAPTYTAATTLILDMRNIVFQQQRPMVTDIALDSAFVESQVEVLRSRSVLLPVVQKLRLTENAEFIRGAGDVAGGLPALIGRWLLPRQDTSEFELEERALRTLDSRLSAKRVGLSFIIEISFRSERPDVAADVANAVAEAYLLDQANARYDAARRATSWLQDSLRGLREQTMAADRALVEFKSKNNIISASGRLMNEQQLSELNSELVSAAAQRDEAQARLDGITKILAKPPLGDTTVDPAVVDSLKSDVINRLRIQYLDLSHREADWSARYGPNHSAAVHIRDQMREIRTSLLDELRRIAETYRSEYDIAKQRFENIQRQLAAVISDSEVTNEAQITMRELESAAQSYRTLLDDFRKRQIETVQQQSFPMTEGRIISIAVKPLSAYWPRASIILPTTAIGGVVLGIVLAFLADLMTAMHLVRRADG